MAVCVSIIAKDNSPQYIASSDFEKELELQYAVHSALDVVEEKCAPGLKPTQDSRDLYLGLLYSTEAHKIYGYVTNTKIKFIIVIDSNSIPTRENEVRSMFRNLHVLYTDAVCNPFYTPGEPLNSKTFDRNVRNITSWRETHKEQHQNMFQKKSLKLIQKNVFASICFFVVAFVSVDGIGNFF